MCSDTRSAGGGSHRSSGIRRADLPARRQQLGGGWVQSLCVPRTKSWPFPGVGLRPRVGSDWAPSEIRFTCPTRGCWQRGWEKLQNTTSVKSQRLQVETRKRKKGTERNRVVSKKKNQLTHPFYPTARKPWNLLSFQLFANTVLHCLSYRQATVTLLLFSQIMELFLVAHEAPWGYMVIHSLNRYLLHLMKTVCSDRWYGSNVTLGPGSSLSAEDPRTAGYCQVWQTQRYSSTPKVGWTEP